MAFRQSGFLLIGWFDVRDVLLRLRTQSGQWCQSSLASPHGLLIRAHKALKC